MNFEHITQIITWIFSLGALIGSISAVILTWRKARTETRKIEADTLNSQADAAETALKSTQLATDQLIRMQSDLAAERLRRVEQDKKIDHLEIEIATVKARLKRLEAQVISLGAEPVK